MKNNILLILIIISLILISISIPNTKPQECDEIYDSKILCLDEGDPSDPLYPLDTDNWHGQDGASQSYFPTSEEENFCGNNGNFLVHGKTSRPRSFTINTPPLSQAGQYSLSIWYSIEDTQENENFVLICGISNTRYEFLDENLAEPPSGEYYMELQPPVSCDFKEGINIITIEELYDTDNSAHFEQFQITGCLNLENQSPTKKLPFFTFTNLLISIMAIILIYILAKTFKHKQKS